ncbi:MAG: metallophosphoesterase [Verrucomicrobium sp.]|nr:metallophosphoesterase [Verrucomicrobium sp.]
MLTRRQFIAAGTASAAAAGGAFLLEETCYSPFPRQLRITHHAVPGPGALAGKRIAVAADLHIGHFFGPEEFRILLSHLEELKPDMVAFPGDFTDVAGADLGEYLDLHGRRPWTTYFSPGNHDKTGPQDTRTQRDLAAAGWRVLCNEREDHADYAVIGMESGLRGPIDYGTLKTRKFKIVLGHEPDFWRGYLEPNLLHLAGHSHGGQVQLFGGPLILPEAGRIYYQGRYERGNNNRLIVSRGIGTKMVNVRINCPPEIVVVTFT